MIGAENTDCARHDMDNRVVAAAQGSTNWARQCVHPKPLFMRRADSNINPHETVILIVFLFPSKDPKVPNYQGNKMEEFWRS